LLNQPYHIQKNKFILSTPEKTKKSERKMKRLSLDVKKEKQSQLHIEKKEREERKKTLQKDHPFKKSRS